MRRQIRNSLSTKSLKICRPLIIGNIHLFSYSGSSHKGLLNSIIDIDAIDVSFLQMNILVIFENETTKLSNASFQFSKFSKKFRKTKPSSQSARLFLNVIDDRLKQKFSIYLNIRLKKYLFLSCPKLVTRES